MTAGHLAGLMHKQGAHPDLGELREMVCLEGLGNSSITPEAEGPLLVQCIDPITKNTGRSFRASGIGDGQKSWQ